MAKCNIQVLLDEPTRIYVAGEEIKGHVQVDTDGDVKCDALTIVLEANVSGKGNGTSKEVEKIEAFVGKWVGQSRHQYPFSFRVPEDARPYHGTLLNVSYQVHARADVPWALDPKDSAPVGIAYPDDTVLEYSWDDEAVRKGKNPGCFYVPLVMLLLGGVGMVGAELTRSDLAPVTLVLFILGCIGVLLFGRGWMATKRLGSVELSFEMGAGGGYRVAEDKDAFFVVVKTGTSKSVTAITADLRVLEQVVRGSGSNRRTYSHPLFKSSVTLEKAQEGVYRGRIILPVDGECPPTITFRDNTVVWQVAARVDIPNWPDWTKRVAIHAAPKRRV